MMFLLQYMRFQILFTYPFEISVILNGQYFLLEFIIEQQRGKIIPGTKGL